MIFNRPRRQAKEEASRKWYFNETLTSAMKEFSVNFGLMKNSRQSYDGISKASAGMKYTYGIKYDTVYMLGKWQNVTYRTVIFTEPPTGDLLTWLQANATPQ